MTKHLYRIREVAEMLGVAESTLRFWESRISVLKPERSNGQRRYTQKDVELCEKIKTLVHDHGMRIELVESNLAAGYRKHPPRNPYVCKTSEDALNLLCDAAKMIEDNPHVEERLKAVRRWIEALDASKSITNNNI